MVDRDIGNQSYPAAIRVFDAVYEDGVLKPLQDPGLPEHHHFSVQVRELRETDSASTRLRQRTFGSAQGLIKIADDFDKPLDLQGLNDLASWSRDIDTLVAAIPPEDFVRLNAALAEADKEAKDLVRLQYGPQESPMGIAYINGEVRGSTGHTAIVHFLVDSGVTYSLLAAETWQALGLQPKRSASFVLADGTQIERKISECHVTLPQGEGHTPVIMGEEGDEPLLGAVTLEILGLVLNPFNRTLQPMRMMLS